MRDLAPLLAEGFQFSPSDLAPRVEHERLSVSDTQTRAASFVGYPAEFLADFPDFDPNSAQRRKKA